MLQQLLDKIENLREEAETEIEQINSEEEYKQVKSKFLGKKSELNKIFRHFKDLSDDEKKQVGKAANDLKKDLNQLLEEREKELQQKKVEASINESFDITLPGQAYKLGSLHPITLIQREVEQVFTRMGFNIVDGPEVETDYYNFEALNTPENHPARDMQDTYWLENGQLLRTHTSPCQIRAMQEKGAPLRIIAPGRCFRNETVDASHENTFFQVEGMIIDKEVSIANLIYIMKVLLSEIFNSEIDIRLRPGFFPFVEPGFELDISCLICGGEGCPTCDRTGWLELLPCGMVHPNVLEYGDIDPEKYTGFAFGLGLTRLVMMKYGINDIRIFNSGNLDVLQQFSVL